MKHVSLDIETLGNNSKSVIISLGAVEFDENGLGREFYMNIDPQSCVEAGLVMDTSTVMWWMQQSDAARAVFKTKAERLEDVCHEFKQWFPKDACVWGNGATFDNVIVDSAYRAVNMNKPWKYNADRCYRTLKALYPQIKALSRIGTHHNALDDAKYQALHAIEIMKVIK
jgi:exodeoxyribonuclease VIII